MRILRAGRGSADAALLEEAARCVAGGGTLIFPTDTVYGIGCAAEDERAVEAVYVAKRRPEQKPLAVHLADAAHAADYAERLSLGARAVIDRFWPGPVSLIVARRPGRVEAAARGGATIALRCPDDALCRAILEATGPLAATSANISGAPAYRGDDGVDALPEATLAIIAGPTQERRESTMLDCSTDTVRVVREGALDATVIADALAGIAPFVR